MQSVYYWTVSHGSTRLCGGGEATSGPTIYIALQQWSRISFVCRDAVIEYSTHTIASKFQLLFFTLNQEHASVHQAPYPADWESVYRLFRTDH